MSLAQKTGTWRRWTRWRLVALLLVFVVFAFLPRIVDWSEARFTRTFMNLSMVKCRLLQHPTYRANTWSVSLEVGAKV